MFKTFNLLHVLDKWKYDGKIKYISQNFRLHG